MGFAVAFLNAALLNGGMTMANPISAAAAADLNAALAATLKLQEVDVVRSQLETQLKQIPAELAALAKTAAEEKAVLDARRKAAQELEIQRKDMDNRLKSAEAQVQKFKIQQVEVRKNDEFQALSHQIATAEAEVGAIETEELEQMMKIDEAGAALRAAEAEHKIRAANLDGQIALVHRKEAQCRTNLEAQSGTVEAAAASVPANWRRAYDTAKSRAKRPPYVAALDDHRCGGCHLRVSNEISEVARHGGKPVACDSCGRVVYWPS
jgi:hypothetical protein